MEVGENSGLKRGPGIRSEVYLGEGKSSLVKQKKEKKEEEKVLKGAVTKWKRTPSKPVFWGVSTVKRTGKKEDRKDKKRDGCPLSPTFCSTTHSQNITFAIRKENADRMAKQLTRTGFTCLDSTPRKNGGGGGGGGGKKG